MRAVAIPRAQKSQGWDNLRLCAFHHKREAPPSHHPSSRPPETHTPMDGLAPNLSAMPLDALHNHPTMRTEAQFDDLNTDELAEVVAQSLLSVPAPNFGAGWGAGATARLQYLNWLCNRIRNWNEAVPILARRRAGTAMLRPLKLMADLMELDPIETAQMPNEARLQYVQRLDEILVNRCRWVGYAWRYEVHHALLGGQMDDFLDAGDEALSTTTDPMLNGALTKRVARAIWYGRHGDARCIYRAMTRLIQQQQDQIPITLSALPPTAVPTLTFAALDHFISANLNRPIGQRVTQINVSRLILQATRSGSHLAIRQLVNMRHDSLTIEHLRNAIEAAVLQTSFQIMTELNANNVIVLDEYNGAQHIQVAHMDRALRAVTTAAQLQVLYSAFTDGSHYSQEQIRELNYERTTVMRDRIRAHRYSQHVAPVTVPQLMYLAVVPGHPIGSHNALFLIEELLGNEGALAAPHPNRAQLAPFAMQYLHPQVTFVADRVQLERSDLPEYANYNAETNTFN